MKKKKYELSDRLKTLVKQWLEHNRKFPAKPETAKVPNLSSAIHYCEYRKVPQLIPRLKEVDVHFKEFLRGGMQSESDLNQVFALLHVPSDIVSQGVTPLIGYLLPRSELARHGLISLLGSKSGTARFNAVICTDKDTPRDLLIAVIRKALTDKSARVRDKAAEWTQWHEVKELIADLHAASLRTKNAEQRKWFQRYATLLEVGFAFEPDEDGGWLHVYDRGGTPMQHFTKSEIARLTLPELVRRMKSYP